MKTIQLTLQYEYEGAGEPFDVDYEITDEEYALLVRLIQEYREQEFPGKEEYVEGGIFTEEFLCEKAPGLYEKLEDFANERITEEMNGLGFEEDEILYDVTKSFEISNGFIEEALHPEQ